MNEVEFHTGLTEGLGFACRLLRKAHRQGARVLVTAPPERLADLDRALWLEPERDFVPHVRMPGAAPRVAARTPIWLAPHAGVPGAGKVLINWGAEAPAELAGWARVIELVTADPDDAAAGRERWRHYRACGLEVRHHGAA